MTTRLAAVLAALSCAAACSLGAPAPTLPAAGPGPAPAAPSPPTRPAFGPYVDTSAAMPDLAALATRVGLRHVVLAFALADAGACRPVWGGGRPLDAVNAAVTRFRAAGGSVTVATGGADGPYLENACGSGADLAAAYTTALDTVGANLLDIDIEHDVPVAVVVDALSRVQRARGTDITLTLPVDLTGLGPAQLDLIRQAAASTVSVTVNVLDMNFRGAGTWGQAMTDAVRATLAQLRAVHPAATDVELARALEITIMIGRNDNGVITRPGDAQSLVDFATSHGVGRLGIWSLGRDRGTCAQEAVARPDCSGIAQADYQFTRRLAAFTGPPS